VIYIICRKIQIILECKGFGFIPVTIYTSEDLKWAPKGRHFNIKYDIIILQGFNSSRV
jgi:hypothetical protein